MLSDNLRPQYSSHNPLFGLFEMSTGTLPIIISTHYESCVCFSISDLFVVDYSWHTAHRFTVRSCTHVSMVHIYVFSFNIVNDAYSLLCTGAVSDIYTYDIHLS